MFFELAEYVQRVIVETFQQAGVTLPDRRIILVGGSGSAVHDCEQLSISLEQTYSGAPGDQAQEPVKCDAPLTCVFGIELVRCVPQPSEGRSTKPQSVTPADYAKAAAIQMKDAELLMEAGLAAAEGTYLRGGMADVTAGTPSGGLQAMVMSLVIVAGDIYP